MMEKLKKPKHIIVWQDKDGGFSITSLPARERTTEALEALAKSILPDGATLIPIYTPDELPPAPPELWKLVDGIPTIDPSKQETRLWYEIRVKRTPLLAEADILVNKAADQGIDVTPFREYRQALRDITDQPDPRTVKWPEKPQWPTR